MRALLFVILALSVPGSAAETAAQRPQRFETKVTAVLNYLLYLPPGYDPAGSAEWPLVLFLHGSGERGTDVARVSAHGPPRLLAEGRQLPAIVVSPQCPPGEQWSSTVLLALLDDLCTRHKVDRSRIILTGISMGGGGAWGLGLRHAGRFAALVPICGRFDPALIPSLDPPHLEQVKRLPIRIYHGAQDKQVKVEESERAAAELKKIGAMPQLTIYPEAAHDSWTQTYENPELWEWMLQQRR